MSRGARRAFLPLCKPPLRKLSPQLALGVLVAALACHTAWGQTAPTVSGISLNSAGADNTYATGDEIEASITFSEVVHVFEGEVGGVQRGQLHLLLAIGAATRQAQFCGGSGSTTLRFCYEVRSGDEDTAGISIGRLATALVDGVIESATGVAATRAFAAQAADSTRRVDGVAPTPGTPTLNTPATGDTYYFGETIEATVTFSEAVNVIESNALGQLRLALSIGANTRLADYATGSGTASLVFAYVVQADDEDIDGISIAAGARSLTGGGITDAAGNFAGRNFNALGQSANHKVDGGRDVAGPTITDVRLSSTPAVAGTYATGATIEVTVTFNEVVQVTGNPMLTLTVGATARNAGYHGGDGTTALAFRYTVQAGEVDTSGVSVPAGPAALTGGTIQDGAGNGADRTFARLTDQPLHQVEAVAPTVVGNVAITSSPAAGNTYVAGEVITADVVFNENIIATGAPALELAVGSARRQAAGARAATPTTMTFSYTVAPGDQDADGITVAAGPGSLTGGTITDAVGNPASRAFTGLPAAQADHRVDGGTDGAAPTVSAVRMHSNAGTDQTYALGDVIAVAIEFSEVVYVPRNARPRLTLSVGADSAFAAYHDGSGTNTLIFRYVVVEHDVDPDGISIGTLATALTGGTIEDGAGNAAVRSHAGLDAGMNHQVEARAPRVTTTGPAVAIVSDPDATGPDDDTYNRGDVIRITLTFDEVVHVTATPQLALSIGPATRQARYVDGSGTETLEFRYTVQPGEVDEDGISVNPNSLTGGGIEDAVGNAAVRTFAGLAASIEHKVDGGADAVAPTVTTVRVSSDPNAGTPGLTPDTYAGGDNIEVEVTFDEVVHVTGAPAIILALGDRSQGAPYHRGSGTDTLTFRYPVREGDVDTDGISIGPGPGALSGGAIVDGAGTAAVRAFTGLPRQIAHLVDATSPTVTEVRITSSPGADNVYTIGESITGTVTFSEEVNAVNAEIELLIGDGGASPVRRVPLSAGVDRRVLSFTYAVQRGDSDDGVSIGPDGLVGGTIRDDAGNPARRRFAGLQHRAGGSVDGGRDTVAPTVLSVAAVSDPGADYLYAAGDHIEVAVDFSEVVHVSGDPELTLTVGATPRQAAYHRGGGTARLVFRHTVLPDEEDDDGFEIGAGPGALSGGGIHDGAGNPADRAFANVGRLAGHRVDAAPPRAVSPAPLAITSDPTAGDDVPPNTYERGDTIRVTATFDEPVQVRGAPNLTLTTDNGPRQARYQSGSGTTVLTFDYTVLRGDEDVGGIEIAANALSCDDSPASAPLDCLVDVAGNPASHVVAGLAANIDHKVDGNLSPAGPLTDGPFIGSVLVLSNPGTYAAGDKIEVQLHYRTGGPGGTVPSPVFVSGSPTLTLVLGSRERPADFAGGSGTNTLTFAYTVEPGDEAPTGLAFPPHPRQKVQGGTIQDAAGHNAYRVFDVGDPGMHAADATELERHKVDGVAPRVTSVAIISDPGADDTYKRGEDIRVEVRFSEPLGVTNTPSLTLDLLVGERRRTAQRTATTANPPSMTFTYTVQDGDSDTDGVSIEAGAFRGGEITDRVGNDAILGGVALDDQADHLVDGAASGAVVRIVSDAGPDQTYGIGDTIAIEVLLDDSSFIASPTLRLLLQMGVAIRQAKLVTGRRASLRLLTFEYTVQEGDFDADGISIDADGLREDAFQVVPPTLAPLPNQAAHRVDAVPPGVAEVEITSTPAADNTYRQGELIRVTVTFNEVVHVTGTPGLARNPGLTLAMGERFPTARYLGGSGTRTLSFGHRVQGGDRDENGISIGPDALVGGLIEDGAGNELTEPARRLRPVPQDAAHKVDGGVDSTAPTIDGVYVISTPRVGNTYATGETIEVQVVFSEAVNVREVDIIDGVQVELERPVLELDLTSSGSRFSRSARLAPEDDASDTLTFRYTVRDGDFDDDGVSIPANAVTGGTITDYRGSGAVADRSHDAVPPNREQQIDAVRPRVVRPPELVSNPETPSDGYGLGEKIVVRVSFNEPVHVTGEPVLRLSIGRRSRDALFANVYQGSALEFHYRVQSGDTDDNGVSIGPDALQGGTILDAVGNMWTDRRLPASAHAAEHRVQGASDFLAPVVTKVAFESPERTYRLNDNVDVGVTFNEPVFVVAGSPALRLSIGADLRAATYRTGSGTSQLHFRYVVQPGDSDPDGISIGPNALSGGTVQDEAGNDAVLTFVGLAQQPLRKVDPLAEEAPKPTGTPRIASRPAAANTYRAGEDIDVNMTFSKTVHVSGQVSLLLSIGPNARLAPYASGSGTETLTFRYNVLASDQDDNGISIGPGPAALVGGVISDASGNFALRNFYPLTQDDRHKVDGVPPAIGDAPTILSAPARRDTYKAGEAISVRVRFGENVRVTGEPVLALRVGTTRREAALISGNGTAELVFRYIVQDGDLDEDGVSAAPDALQGGAITDLVGNPASRRLPVLEPQGKHKVDGVVATAVAAIASSPEDGDTYRAGEGIEVNVTFSESVEVAGVTGLKLALIVGEAVREADFVRLAEDGRTLSFRYTVAYGDFDADGVAVQGDALTGGTAADLAGNPVRRTLTLADQGAHKVDTSVTLEHQGTIGLKVGGTAMQLNLTDVLAYTGLYNAPSSSDSNVAVAQVSGHRLTISPVAEGAAVITVTAQARAQITLTFNVVVTASAAEIAVLTHSFAAMGRGLLASAAHTIGSRLELGPGQRKMSLLVGGRRFDPHGWEAASPSAGCPLANGFGEPGFGTGCAAAPPASGGHHALWPHSHQPSAAPHDRAGGFGGWPGAHGGLWRNSAFEMPLLGVGGGGSWSLWGGGDFSSFSGEPEDNAYDGNLSAVYIGMDGRGDGWVAGGAFGRVSGEADYEYKGIDMSGKGSLETSLTTFHPYVGWSPSDKAKAWVVLGFGRGEASMQREDQQYDATPTDISMRMGLVGARGTIGEPGGLDFSLRADAGTLSLETGSGLKAIDALEVAVQRVRLGMELSYTSNSGPVVGGVRLSGASGGGGKFTPFVELAARFDGGDGQGGTGAEVAAGLRYQSAAVSFEAKARTLTMQGDEEYSETGASATLVVAPGGDRGRGLRLSVSPRWGGASEATDVFFQRDYAARAARRHNTGAAYDEWRMNARVGYEMPLRGRAGTVTPFAETDVAGAGGKRARVGFSYETKARHGAPVRFNVSGERLRDARGTEHRLLVGAEGRF